MVSVATQIGLQHGVSRSLCMNMWLRMVVIVHDELLMLCEMLVELGAVGWHSYLACA